MKGMKRMLGSSKYMRTGLTHVPRKAQEVLATGEGVVYYFEDEDGHVVILSQKQMEEIEGLEALKQG